MSKYKKIKELEVGSKIKQVFLVSRLNAKKTKSGKDYTQLILKDKTGELDVKIFDMDPHDYPNVNTPVFAEIEISVEEWKGSKTAKGIGLPMLVPEPQDKSDYENDLGLSKQEADQYYDALMQYKDQVKDKYIKCYLDVIFDHPETAAKFKEAPASSTNRGAYRGGLVEHVFKVMLNADAIINSQSKAKTPTNINRDIVIAGVLVHDLGKVYAYSVNSLEASTTRAGHLLQHLPMSYGWSIQAFIQAESIIKQPIPEEIKDHIHHIILAHHGLLEYGSPVRPSTVEAQIVHVADMSDSTVSNFAEVKNANEDMAGEDGMGPGNFFTSKHMYLK